MLLEAEFWVAVAFVLFMAVVWKVGGFNQLTQALDSRARRVRSELDEARRLREEAAGVLDDYKRRRSDAEREAEIIISGAKAEAKRIADESHERLNDFIARRTRSAEAKIAQAEAQATAQVRAAAADTAVRVSEVILKERMQGDAAQDLVRLSLGEVRNRLRA